ncbi:MAG: MBL fold metallo-hydrolase [Gemmatimonadetes bacterium]|jgi:glyoxylase-like metal-dependent hydrolase (beta-lactamase superfamily II)|nr:MBL fold metallo-hydrolase [Gemmatimonadota bacterium]MBT7863078.1 MBL fold metallo-hydrolase [Gemmatimonadota bacterium]
MIEELTAGVWKVGGGSWLGVAQACSSEDDCNVYLIAAGDALLLIDTGRRAGKAMIEANIREAGFRPESLTNLLLSHSHFDHSDAASAWQSNYDVAVHLNRTGTEYLERGDHRLVGYQILTEPGYEFQQFRVDHRIDDAEVFDVGDLTIEARAMAGHTPDSMVFETTVRGHRLWICGDTTFAKDCTGEWGCIGWQNILWESDLEVYRASLERMLDMSPPDLLLPGHGNTVSGEETIRRAVEASHATVVEMMANPHRRHFGL